MNKSFNKMMRGFTLVELMVVVAILAILAAIAIPSYQIYIRKSRVKEATTVIVDNVKMMERYYAMQSTFRCDNAAAARLKTSCQNNVLKAVNPDSETSSIGKFYDFVIRPETNQGGAVDTDNYVITARPKSGTYSDNVENSESLYVIYRSRTNTYVECTKAGAEASLANSATGNGAGCRAS